MNKKITKILATSVIVSNLLPLTNAIAATTIEPDYDTINTIEETHHYNDKCDEKANIKIIKKNLNCLSACDKKDFEEITKEYKKNKKLTNEQKCKLIKLREQVIKSKLGDDYEEYTKLTKIENPTKNDKKKLDDYRKKVFN